MIIHRGAFLQRGRGIGSIFASLFKAVVPAFKSIGRAIIKSPITKSALSTAKNKAIDAGIQIAADALSGENIGQSISKNLKTVSSAIGDDVVSSLKGKVQIKPVVATNQRRKRKRTKVSNKSKKGRKKTGQQWTDIYDEYSE